MDGSAASGKSLTHMMQILLSLVSGRKVRHVHAHLALQPQPQDAPRVREMREKAKRLAQHLSTHLTCCEFAHHACQRV